MADAAQFSNTAKALSATLAGSYVALALVPRLARLLALVPGKTLPCVWMTVTSGFVELHFVSAVFNAAALLLLCRLVEPRWGSAELLRFAAATAAGAGLATFLLLFLAYVASRNEYILYGPVAGGQALVAGMLVAVKQLFGEQELSVASGALRLRGKHAPAAFLGAYVLLCTALGAGAMALHATAGAAAAWVYLRHFQCLVEGAPAGDPSPSFAAETFLPAALQPASARAAATCARLCCGGSGAGAGAGGGVGAPAPPPEGTPLPGSDPFDASRRRERGARALQERLAGAKPAGGDAAAAAAAAAAPADTAV